MKSPQNIAILFIGLDKYSLYYDRFYKSVEKNFLPDASKHFFIFSDEEFLIENDNETFIKTESYDTPRDIKLHKFHFIKSAWNKIKKYDYVFYFDADNVVRGKINYEDLFDHDKSLIGVVHPWAWTTKDKFESDPNSGAYIEKEKVSIPYHQSCFWGGDIKKIEDMVEKCHETLEKDIKSGHENENNICDEVHVNKYFALNSEDLYSLGKDYANPAEAYQTERRLHRKAFGNNIMIAHDNAHQTYRHSLGLIEKQKNLKNNFLFAGWAQVKDNTKATFEMLKVFKSVNPNAHVHITNGGEEDYSDICEAFDCTINQDESMKDRSAGNRMVEYDIWSWFQNLKTVCSSWLNKYEWIIILEDDVESFNAPIDQPEFSLAGPDGPCFSEDLFKLIQKKFPKRKIPKRYIGCGISLLNVQAFLAAINQMTEESWLKFCEADERLIKYADISLSFLLAYAGYPIGGWSEFCSWTDPLKENKAFAHGNKEYYEKKINDDDLDYLDYVKYSKIFINLYAHSKEEDVEFRAKEELTSVEHHSFFKYLINPDGTCIDVGCGDFAFTNEIKDLCSKVIAIDPGENINPPENNKVIFLNQSLTTSDSSSAYLVKDGRLSAHYTSLERVGEHCSRVPNLSLDNLVNIFKLRDVDLIKLGCEGSEYSILYWLSKNPIAKQISVSFHDHLGRNPYKNTMTYYEGLFFELKKNYYIVKHTLSSKGEKLTNYDDSLFVRK
jgi:hypothetical protein